MHRTLAHTDGGWFFAMHRAVGAYRWMAVFINGDGNPMTKATAEGRFFPMGMAICRWRQPPKDGCIIVAPGWLAYLGSVAEEESTAEERLYKSREIF